MKTKTILATTIAAAIMSATASAAEVKVEWQNVDDYRDIEAVNEIQSRFEKRIIDGLTEYWKKLGERLPADNTLSITMTDLDITGRVEPTYGATAASYVRVLDEISYPSMSFSYTYTDAQGNVISEDDDVRIKDLGARSGTIRSVMGSGKDTLYFEKRLMDRWFSETFNQ
ncbi:DUF3016 domain-containing protein [Pseudidiomarina insulisalsae]|uniref:DUF3016 domain-containing protein n=1 Tax=Pseudidiomarina insulisalsae TaxID=575789 RepID=A0A432YQ19_9GAMM|nr:DUF3016 domain-containing protein [Pseudidiomarina insulisalsae]RUO63495.1 DUF3016 domain-containing protein [Pseudidiomarina insulisalsae]